MPTKRRFEERSSGEEYLHKSAWCVVGRQLEYAVANPRGALYDDLVAMMFAFHCIEGFLNFVGEKIAPDLWEDEKNQFIGTGIDGKLDAICKQCGLSQPDKGRRPYSTLSMLKVLRDAMAHPKIHRTQSVKPFTEGKKPSLFSKTYLSELVSHEKAVRARDDVKRIADQIHKSARGKFPDADLGTDALEGIMATTTGETRQVGQVRFHKQTTSRC
jgi:hypothetical protein